MGLLLAGMQGMLLLSVGSPQGRQLAEQRSPTTGARDDLGLEFVVMSLGTPERQPWVQANQHTLPSLRVQKSVNGYDKEETTQRLAASKEPACSRTYASAVHRVCLALRCCSVSPRRVC